MINVLYLGTVEVMREIMTKSIRENYLVTDQRTPKPEENLFNINVSSGKICKSANQVEIGMFAKRLRR